MTLANQAELAALIEQNTGMDGVFSTILPGVFLLRASHPTAPIHTIYEPSHCFVAHGRKQVSAGSLDDIYKPGAALAVSIGLPVRGQVLEASPQEPFLCLRIELRQETFAELRGNIGSRSHAPVFGPGWVSFNPRSLWKTRLSGQCSFSQNRETVGVLWPLLEKEISYHLLSECSSPVLSQRGFSPSAG